MVALAFIAGCAGEYGVVGMRPGVEVSRLADADREFDGEDWRYPEAGDVVRFVGEDYGHLRRGRVETAREGDRFFFQGRLYLALHKGQAQDELAVQPTEIVRSRVVRTFKRPADELVDLLILYESGQESLITGTPEHPFFVPAVNDYVPMGELRQGTVLKTDDGSVATVKSATTRHGDYKVYNFEVEGVHNYYVVIKNGGHSVLVHNNCSVIDDSAEYAAYWTRKAPNQVTPGTKRLDHLRESGRTGRMEKSRVIYDDYGRQTYRVDMTDHMRPNDHSNPHLHVRTYNSRPGNHNYTDGRF